MNEERQREDRVFRPSILRCLSQPYVEWKNVTRLCHKKPLLTVNGEYPGPTIAVHEGDNVEIKVTNRIAQNTTIHWHGIRQIRTGWADGPAYITQCEWWNGDIDSVESEMMKYGGGPAISNAYTINGLPGPFYNCSNKDTLIITVEHGKTYMLRIINAALNDELFFAVANHTLTVVEIDAKPFKTKAIMITPGQTTNVLLTANQVPDSSGMFLMAAWTYLTSVFPFNNSTTAGFLQYKNPMSTEHTSQHPNKVTTFDPVMYNFPQMEDTKY
ncbi:hypothetical protein ACLB2K_052306 [Fragaria x ananassa]